MSHIVIQDALYKAESVRKLDQLAVASLTLKPIAKASP